MLLRILYSFENSLPEFVLPGSVPSDGRVQFDLQWNDVLSTHPAYVSQLFGSYPHGLSYYQNSYFGNTLHTGTNLFCHFFINKHLYNNFSIQKIFISGDGTYGRDINNLRRV